MERTIFHQGLVGPWLLLLIEFVPPRVQVLQKRCCAAMAQPRRKTREPIWAPICLSMGTTGEDNDLGLVPNSCCPRRDPYRSLLEAALKYGDPFTWPTFLGKVVVTGDPGRGPKAPNIEGRLG